MEQTEDIGLSFFMENYSISDVLNYRKWRHALFTTYALSLTFFESFVMRELRGKGCRDVSLVVDVDGYQMSLSERRSHLVGQDYRLIPVALPSGVFHAKCMYLSSDEGDLLVVGSGNMTFGGFGRNLEVFEILSPDVSPRAFEDFAEFLEYLSIKEDWLAPDRSWLENFAGFAKRAAGNTASSPRDQPRLWHTVAETATDQLVEFLAGKGEVKEINVLSPFFDNDGSAVLELSQKLKPQALNIGLPTNSYQSVNFPFNRPVDWGGKLGAFKPVVSSENRTLHAKWLQVKTDGEIYNLTGSINATRKALCSTDNVEVGIIRRADPENPSLLLETEKIPGTVVTFPYRTSGLGKKCLVYATLRQDSTLLGCILGNTHLEGNWFGMLENKSGEHCEFEAHSDDQGVFICHLQLSEQILFGPGLQISMEKDEIVGRGWVNHEDILCLTKEERSFVRLINREDTIDDEIALMDYLAICATRHQLAFKSSIINHKKKIPSQEVQKEKTPITIELAAIAPDDSLYDGSIDPLGAGGGDRSDLMLQIRRILLGHNRNAEEGEGADIELDTKNPSNDGKTQKQRVQESRENRAAKASLDNFQASMKVLIRDAESELARKTALVIWYEVSMYMFRRHKQNDEAARFLHEWFWRVAQEHYSADDAGALEQHFVTTAAVSAAKWLEDQDRERYLIQIHEGLESYWRGAVDFKYAIQVLIEDHNIGFAAFLMDEKPADLTKALWEVFQTRTICDVLNEQVRRYRSGMPLNEKASVFSGPVGKEFLAMAKRCRGREFFRSKIGGHAEDCCPKCFTTLVETQKYNLRYLRMAHCVQCNYFVLDLEP